MGSGKLIGVAISFAATAAMVWFTAYQYRNGTAFSVKWGWTNRAEEPVRFWSLLLANGLMIPIFALPGINVLLQP
jgi:hypothetical protein